LQVNDKLIYKDYRNERVSGIHLVYHQMQKRGEISSVVFARRVSRFLQQSSRDSALLVLPFVITCVQSRSLYLAAHMHLALLIVDRANTRSFDDF